MRLLGFRFNFGRLFPAATAAYCEICMEQVPSASIFRTTGRCKHSYCRRCLSSYITTAIGDGVANVRCPGLQCRARLDPLRFKELLSRKSFLTWCDSLCESHVLGLERCYCPNLNCREVIVNECGRRGSVERFECPSCRRPGCFQCASKWVEGHRCRGRHDVDISLLKRLADRKKWAQCPNCHILVERSGGCDRIYCRCGTKFCYRCGCVWKRGYGCLCERRTEWFREEVVAILATCIFLMTTAFIIVVIPTGISSDRQEPAFH
ncbi:RING-type domain-containing protein [Psidium guajava]|nr:RING-type domain-containing protein [Psidium guajava]